MDVTTVADDLVVMHDGATVHRFEDLRPASAHIFYGTAVRTLAPPPGELLARFATVNDVHFGEVECGMIEGVDGGPVMRAVEGAPPYPVTMNAGAVAEIEAIAPDAVIVKGDLTSTGAPHEYDQFVSTYEPVFADRLDFTGLWIDHNCRPLQPAPADLLHLAHLPPHSPPQGHTPNILAPPREGIP